MIWKKIIVQCFLFESLFFSVYNSVDAFSKTRKSNIRWQLHSCIPHLRSFQWPCICCNSGERPSSIKYFLAGNRIKSLEMECWARENERCIVERERKIVKERMLIPSLLTLLFFFLAVRTRSVCISWQLEQVRTHVCVRMYTGVEKYKISYECYV